MADISGQAKPDPLFKKWTDRCMDEFFAQGDQEAALGLPISPNCDRHATVPAESQVGFIKYVVAPAYEVLGMFVPFVHNHVLQIIDRNMHHWLVQAENGPEEAAPMENSSRNEVGESSSDNLDESFVSASEEHVEEIKGAACKEETIHRSDSHGPVEVEA